MNDKIERAANTAKWHVTEHGTPWAIAICKAADEHGVTTSEIQAELRARREAKRKRSHLPPYGLYDG